jgi:hypothetical protein
MEIKLSLLCTVEAEIAQKKNVLMVTPEFKNKFAKYITKDYQEGNLFSFFGTKNPKEEWA